jgi:2-oxoglutarate ferredoxin oxidoreductase subunit gamma
MHDGDVGEAVCSGLLSHRDFVEVRFSGSGGQGLILMGVILAVAAVRDGRQVVQTQSYGPEARGGSSRSDVIIANEPIDYPQLTGADLLVALSAPAAERYLGMLKRGGLFIFDSDLVPAPLLFKGCAYGIPFTRLAVEVTGKAQAANIVTLGAAAGLAGVVSMASLEASVRTMVPRGTEEMNMAALRHGWALDPEEWQLRGGPAAPLADLAGGASGPL